MKSAPLIRPQTKRRLDQLLSAPAGSIILYGPKGVGKDYLAEYIASQLLNSSKLDTGSYYLRIDPNDKNTISIDEIRRVGDFLRLKVPGSSQAKIRRVVHISAADTMTTEAQNAFLKTLEEPPADTLIIVCANDLQTLLPTILSRASHISVKPVSTDEIRAYFKPVSSPQTEQHLRLSDGLPGLFAALQHDADHPLVAAIQAGKQFVGSSRYERLIRVQSLGKDTVSFADFLWALERITRIGQHSAAEKSDDRAVRQWHGMRKRIVALQEIPVNSVNQKFALTSLSLHL